MALSILAVVVGLIVAWLGLTLPDRVRAPWDGLVAFLTPAGVASALLGVLLLCVPDFFSATPPDDPISLPSGPANGSETRPSGPANGPEAPVGAGSSPVGP